VIFFAIETWSQDNSQYRHSTLDGNQLSFEKIDSIVSNGLNLKHIYRPKGSKPRGFILSVGARQGDVTEFPAAIQHIRLIEKKPKVVKTENIHLSIDEVGSVVGKDAAMLISKLYFNGKVSAEWALAYLGKNGFLIAAQLERQMQELETLKEENAKIQEERAKIQAENAKIQAEIARRWRQLLKKLGIEDNQDEKK
jgi:hypothetical protein